MGNPEEKIAHFAPNWVWNVHRCLATDLAINFVADQVDPATRIQLMASTLETTASAYRTLAEGASNAAKLVAKSRANE